MPIIDLKDAVNQVTTLRTDVCVIGGGFAGLLAAKKLAQADRSLRVVVLEGGDRTFSPDGTPLNRIEDFGARYRAMQGRVKTLGGTSVVWGGRLLPLTEHDVAGREYVDIPQWPIEHSEIIQYQKQIENFFKVDAAAYDEHFAEVIGLQEHLRLGDKDFTLRFPKWPTFKNCNINHLLQHEFNDLENLTIYLSATVDGMTFDASGSRAQSVSARGSHGKTLSVVAKEFLLTGGTLESTRLLLMIKKSPGGKVLEPCSAIGKYFNDHVGASLGTIRILDHAAATQIFTYHLGNRTRRSLHIETTAKFQRRHGVASSYAFVIARFPDNSVFSEARVLLRGLQRGRWTLGFKQLWNLIKGAGKVLRTLYWRAIKKSLYWPKSVELLLHAWIEQVPSAQRFLTLSSELDELGMPRLQMHWGKDDHDEKNFRTIARELELYWERSGLAKVCRIEWADHVRDSGARIVDQGMDLCHPAGSLRMGASPTDSVVNADLQCHLISNLSVASAAVFPSAGGSNPTYSIIQLAFRAADKILERLKAS